MISNNMNSKIGIYSFLLKNYLKIKHAQMKSRSTVKCCAMKKIHKIISNVIGLTTNYIET